MIIRSVHLRQFRTHTSFDADFSQNVTVITGKNGSGKTSIIEALYILLRGSSFRGVDTEIVQHNTHEYKISFETDTETRSVHYREQDGKTIDIHGKKHRRMPGVDKYPIVLFVPDDLQLIHGSPSRRRRYLDAVISMHDPIYGTMLRKYDRALKQRNNLLKHPSVTQEQLFPWDVLLGEYGAYVIDARHRQIQTYNDTLSATYQAIASTNDTVTLRYTHDPKQNTASYLTNALHASYERDRALGNTTVGAHRHDIEVLFNDITAESTASRGETRSIILSLKLIEANQLYDITNKHPLILLDDVFSELDEDRQTHLLDVHKDSQIIITTTHIPAITQAAPFTTVDL